MGENENNKPLEQITDPLPTTGNAPEVVDEGRAKRLANLTQTGRPKGVTRTDKNLTQNEIGDAINQLVAGVPAPIVASAFGISTSSIKRIKSKFRRVFKELGNVADYRVVKAELFDACELTTLKTIADPTRQAKATLNQAAYTLQVLHNAGRLEKNLSTANINSNTYLRFKTTGEGDAK